MTEIKQNWEDEFDEQFKLWSGCRVDEEGYIIPELNNNRLKDFIHKVRTEAILEERKRIKGRIQKRIDILNPCLGGIIYQR